MVLQEILLLAAHGVSAAAHGLAAAAHGAGSVPGVREGWAGLVVAGLVVAGLVVVGLAVAGLVVAGLVVAGLGGQPGLGTVGTWLPWTCRFPGRGPGPTRVPARR
jgi:hypothetical protein